MKKFKKSVSMLCVLACIGASQVSVFADEAKIVSSANVVYRTDNADNLAENKIGSKKAISEIKEDGTVITIKLDTDGNKTYYKNGIIVTNETEITDDFKELELNLSTVSTENIEGKKFLAKPIESVNFEKTSFSNSENSSLEIKMNDDGTNTYYVNNELLTDNGKISVYDKLLSNVKVFEKFKFGKVKSSGVATKIVE